MKFKKSLINASVVAAVLSLAACGGSSSDSTPEPTPPANSAPTDISLSNASVSENAVAAVVGTLSATDSDASDTHTFAVNDDRFAVNGTELAIAEGVSLDFEAAATIDVEVTVTDSASATYTKTLTINVTDLQDTHYAFESPFTEGASSVSYSGQIARHVLINELNYYIGSSDAEYGLQADLDNGVITTREDVLTKLNKFYNTPEVEWDGFEIKSISGSEQTLMTDLSSYKTLFEKIAGQDDGGQEKDWNAEESPFAGWGTKGSTTPEGLVDIFFNQLADNAEHYINVGSFRTDIQGNPITKVYINTDGTDLKQLIQKFLLMAVPYSQAAGDYLGEETEGKGLTTDNTAGDKDGTKPYSKLEHQFDEGFGYFGAAVNYLDYNDNEIAGKVSSDEDGRADWNGKHDTDGNGTYDLLSEVNFGQSVNAAKRDRGTASNTSATDLSTVTMKAFIEGRRIINAAAPNELAEEQMAALLVQRDIAMDGWERAIAATVVHYINDTNADLELLKNDSASFDYGDLAKHFSEMKGFALGLQFSPYSKISDADFEQLHAYMGNAPVMTSDDIAAYQADLIKARDIIQAALSFDAENVENW